MAFEAWSLKLSKFEVVDFSRINLWITNEFVRGMYKASMLHAIGELYRSSDSKAPAATPLPPPVASSSKRLFEEEAAYVTDL